MAFVKKTWKDRISQFPNRRTVNDGYTTKQVMVGRDEGTITEEGDSFDAANMNDLEQRIEDAYGDISQMVADEVAQQYDSNSVIFDNVATPGHGVGFVVSSDYIANLKVEDLKDVDISSPQPNQALVFDFTDPDNPKIVNGEVSTVGGLNDLNDVTIDDSTLAEGQELVYNDTDDVFENKTTRVELTQAEYDALVSGGTVLPNVDYYITDAPSMQGTSADLSYDGTTKSTYTKIEEIDTELSGKADSSDIPTRTDFIRYEDKAIGAVEFTTPYYAIPTASKPSVPSGYMFLMGVVRDYGSITGGTSAVITVDAVGGNYLFGTTGSKYSNVLVRYIYIKS